MAVNVLNSTTLSAALDNEAVGFAVASTTNISASFDGDNILVVRGEAMKVVAVDDPASGYEKVIRGWNGTKASAHASGTRVWIGTSNDFKAIKDHATALVGNAGTFPDYLLPGQRATDANGNEYVMVELTATCYSGTTVVISVDGNFTAAQAAGGTQGPIGLTVEQGSSDQFVWAQIYGYNSYAQETIGASAASSAYIAAPATTASTPSVGLAVISTTTSVPAYIIHGMFVVGAATSTVTSATSATGLAVPVFLNYPYTRNILDAFEGST